MKDKRIWILLAGPLLVSTAFLLLNFRVAAGSAQAQQRIMVTELEGRYPERPKPSDRVSLVLVGEGTLARALQEALGKSMDEVGMGQIEWEQELQAKYPNPVLVVKTGEPHALWTPFYAASQFSVQAGYATDGDTTFLDRLDLTQPYIRNPDPSVADLYTEYQVSDRSFGLISRQGYDRYLAEYLAGEIIQALKNLYNIQDLSGGQS